MSALDEADRESLEHVEDTILSGAENGPAEPTGNEFVQAIRSTIGDDAADQLLKRTHNSDGKVSLMEWIERETEGSVSLLSQLCAEDLSPPLALMQARHVVQQLHRLARGGRPIDKASDPVATNGGCPVARVEQLAANNTNDTGGAVAVEETVTPLSTPRRQEVRLLSSSSLRPNNAEQDPNWVAWEALEHNPRKYRHVQRYVWLLYLSGLDSNDKWARYNRFYFFFGKISVLLVVVAVLLSYIRTNQEVRWKALKGLNVYWAASNLICAFFIQHTRWGLGWDWFRKRYLPIIAQNQEQLERLEARFTHINKVVAVGIILQVSLYFLAVVAYYSKSGFLWPLWEMASLGMTPVENPVVVLLMPIYMLAATCNWMLTTPIFYSVLSHLDTKLDRLITAIGKLGAWWDNLPLLDSAHLAIAAQVSDMNDLFSNWMAAKAGSQLVLWLFLCVFMIPLGVLQRQAFEVVIYCWWALVVTLEIIVVCYGAMIHQHEERLLRVLSTNKGPFAVQSTIADLLVNADGRDVALRLLDTVRIDWQLVGSAASLILSVATILYAFTVGPAASLMVSVDTIILLALTVQAASS
eukprot:g29973.t1